MVKKMPGGVMKTRDELPELMRRLGLLTTRQVLVGFPAGDAKANRDEDPGMTNADIAYVQDNGAPEANIPARPFMRPGIENVADKLGSRMKSTAQRAIGSADSGLDEGLGRVGMQAVAGIRARINEGIPPPLSERTLQGRAARGRQGALWELAWRAAGAPAGTDLAKPLIDTGQLRNAVTYVIRSRDSKRGA